jgi:hypothetical protein
MTFPSFSVGETLRAADMNSVGLWLVKTQTVGTGVASVTVTNAFSADYDAYKIIVTGLKNTANDISFSMQLNNAAVSGYFGSFIFVNVTTNTIASASNNNTASWSFVGAAGTGSLQGGAVIDIINPFLIGATSVMASPIPYQNIMGTFTGLQTTNASHTGFTLTAGAGSFTGGTIRVYGYKN